MVQMRMIFCLRLSLERTCFVPWDKVLAVRHLILDVNDWMETAQYVHHWTMSFTATRNLALQGWEHGNIDAAEAKDGTGECG